MTNLKEYLDKDPMYQRLKELVNYFKHNEEFKALNTLMNKTKKNLVKAKVSQNFTLASSLDKDLKDLETKILDLPFVEEYYTLLASFKEELTVLTNAINDFLASNLSLL